MFNSRQVGKLNNEGKGKTRMVGFRIQTKKVSDPFKFNFTAAN